MLVKWKIFNKQITTEMLKQTEETYSDDKEKWENICFLTEPKKGEKWKSPRGYTYNIVLDGVLDHNHEYGVVVEYDDIQNFVLLSKMTDWVCVE